MNQMEKSYSESVGVDKYLRDKVGCLLECKQIENCLEDIGILLEAPIMPLYSDRPIVYKVRPSLKGEAELKKYCQAVQLLYLLNQDRLRLRDQHFRISSKLDSALFTDQEKECFYSDTLIQPLNSLHSSLQNELHKQKCLQDLRKSQSSNIKLNTHSLVDAQTDTLELPTPPPLKKKRSAVFINKKRRGKQINSSNLV